MTRETKDYINEVAERIVSHHNSLAPIDNIKSIVEGLGGMVVEKDAFDSVCDAVAMKTGDNTFTLFVAKHQDDDRKRWAIARTLGNVVLHMGFMTNPERWDEQKHEVHRRFNTYAQDEQAVEFAMALLMPKATYLDIVNANTTNNVVNVEKVAEYFKVSAACVINRGKSLEVLQFQH